MAKRFLRWVGVGGGAALIALGVVFVAVSASGDGNVARAIATGYLGETQRLVERAVASVTPLGPGREDYRVYSAIIDAMFAGDTPAPPVYLMTAWPAEARPVPPPARFHLSAPTDEVIRDFKRTNRLQWALSRDVQLRTPAKWIRPIDLADIRIGEAIERIELSRIGYDDAHGLALVYVAHQCPLCGSGFYVVVQRDHAAKWAIVGDCMVWVS